MKDYLSVEDIFGCPHKNLESLVPDFPLTKSKFERRIGMGTFPKHNKKEGRMRLWQKDIILNFKESENLEKGTCKECVKKDDTIFHLNKRLNQEMAYNNDEKTDIHKLKDALRDLKESLDINTQYTKELEEHKNHYKSKAQTLDDLVKYTLNNKL